jgi:hypothetical protein
LPDGLEGLKATLHDLTGQRTLPQAPMNFLGNVTSFVTRSGFHWVDGLVISLIRSVLSKAR